MSPTRGSGRSQRQRSEATTAELVEAAKKLFAARGYENTSLEEIAAAAKVTKGALYHHFKGKRDLFRAVYEHEARERRDKEVAAFLRKKDPWEGFYAACQTFLRDALDPGYQRIALIDAPAVLGWDTLRDLKLEYSFGQVRQGLELAMDAGRIPRRPAEPLTHMLDGALAEGALLIAESTNPRATMRNVLRELRTLLAAIEAG